MPEMAAALQDSRERFALDLERSRREGFKFGAKLVRGAYMFLEREKAAKSARASPVWDSIQDTHANYDRRVFLCSGHGLPVSAQASQLDDGLLRSCHTVGSRLVALHWSLASVLPGTASCEMIGIDCMWWTPKKQDCSHGPHQSVPTMLPCACSGHGIDYHHPAKGVRETSWRKGQGQESCALGVHRIVQDALTAVEADGAEVMIASHNQVTRPSQGTRRRIPADTGDRRLADCCRGLSPGLHGFPFCIAHSQAAAVHDSRCDVH